MVHQAVQQTVHQSLGLAAGSGRGHWHEGMPSF